MFKDLSEQFQDKIRYYTVRTITFKKESQKDLKFEIFERLNTGSVSLNDQELRNCMFRGPFNNLLKDLAIQPDFTYLLGLSKPDNRMKDVELVLRFTAFHHNTYLNYKPPMKRFLNDEAERYQSISESESTALKKAFKDSCIIIRSLLDRHAFKRFYKGGPKDPNGRWEPKKFNASLHDILMYSFAREDKNRVYQNLDAIRESLINLMTNDDEFINSIELSTSSVQAVTKRFDKWRLALQDILSASDKRSQDAFQRLSSKNFLTQMQRARFVGNVFKMLMTLLLITSSNTGPVAPQFRKTPGSPIDIVIGRGRGLIRRRVYCSVHGCRRSREDLKNGTHRISWACQFLRLAQLLVFDLARMIH